MTRSNLWSAGLERQWATNEQSLLRQDFTDRSSQFGFMHVERCSCYMMLELGGRHRIVNPMTSYYMRELSFPGLHETVWDGPLPAFPETVSCNCNLVCLQSQKTEPDWAKTWLHPNHRFHQQPVTVHEMICRHLLPQLEAQESTDV